nr:PQQ-binding-like beta-propeller repeat protein [Micromonospora sp. DSM 115978]
MVIDLGLDRHPQPPAPPRGWWWSAVRLRPVALVVCGLLLTGLAGSVPAPPPALDQVASHPVDARDLVVLGDRLLVTSIDNAAADRVSPWLLSAYEMPSGRHLWTTRYQSPTGELTRVRRADGLVLINGRSNRSGATTTVVLDAATGRTRWVAPPGLVVADGNVGVLTDDARDTGPAGGDTAPDGGDIGPAAGDIGPGGGDTGQAGGGAGPPAGGVAGGAAEGRSGGAQQVRGLDLGTGAELWRDTVAPGTIALAAPGGRVVLLGQDGRGQVRAARDGRLELSRTLSDGGSPVVVGDTLLLRDRRGGDPGVVGYDLASLAERWGRAVPDGLGRLTQCGPLICFPADRSIVAVDPVTGAPAWRLDRTDLVVDFGTYLVTFEVGTSGNGVARIVHPGTGRTIGPLSDWETALDSRGDSAFLGVRAAPDGRTWFAVLPPPAAALRVLGTVGQPVTGCVGGATNIVCRNGKGTLAIWRYRV